MSQLHLLVVVDSKDGSFHVTGMEEAPVDSDMAVFDDPHWRGPTDAERDTLIDAEARLIEIIRGDTGELGLPFTHAGSVAQALGQVVIDRENASKEEVMTFFQSIAESDPLPFGEDALWDQLGPIVDQIEDAVLAKAGKRLHDGEVEPA